MPNGTSSDQETIEDDNCTVLSCYREGNGKMAARRSRPVYSRTRDHANRLPIFLRRVLSHQSADSKVKLVDRLCHAHFDKTIIKKEWTPLLKDLNSAVETRNSIAHWEANFVLDVSVLEPWEPPIAVTPHHLDARAQADTRGATTNTLNQTAEEFLALANRLLRFVAPHFSDKALRATNLPRRLLLYLENNRNDVPTPTQPP